MYSICLVVIYIGELPSWFNLWLLSCSRNPSISWLLFTDQKINQFSPHNVKIIQTTITDLQHLFSEALEIDVTLHHPYKLCDLRPTYGYVLKNYLNKFQFWGHCDIDMIFGSLRNYLTEDLLSKNNKVQINGHLSLYRNCPYCNNFFRIQAPGIDYREILSSPDHFGFDEWKGIYKLLLFAGIPFYLDQSIYADIRPEIYELRTVKQLNTPHYPQLFYWLNGEVFWHIFHNDSDIITKVAYIHFQKRKMFVSDGYFENGFYILPKSFTPLDSFPLTKIMSIAHNPRSRLDEFKYHYLFYRSRIYSIIRKTLNSLLK